MYLATTIGVVAGLALIVSAGTPYQDLLIDPAQLLFVIGGGLVATLVAHPLAMAAKFPKLLLRGLFAGSPDIRALIERIVAFSEIGRREGILALETELNEHDDPFLAAGTRLAVDGTEPDLIMDILETEVQFIKERHVHHARVVTSFGQGCVLFGGIAALMTITLQGGSGMAGSALLHGTGLPLLYGLLVYGLMGALAQRLRVASAEEVLHKRMVIEGIMSIQSGDNPRIVEHKLSVFVEPAMRPRGDRPSVEPGPPPPVDENLVQQAQAVAAEKRRSHDDPPRFEFEDIPKLSDKSIQAALRAIDQKDLVVGLKGASREVHDKALGNMSSRVRHFIEEEIGFLKVEVADIVETQSRIGAHIRRLAKEEKLELPEGMNA